MTSKYYITKEGKKEDRQLWNRVTNDFKLRYRYQCDNYLVQNQINWLESEPAFVTKMATQAKPYLHYIIEQVEKRGMPGEIALLPMIESAYNPFAYSHSGAAGLWQIMPGTGSGFGLRQNWWYDARRDVFASTRAALDYLTYLNHMFNGNWLLAIAAYNSGEGKVLSAIRWNIDHGLNTDFWSLALPRETQAYVPRLLAMACIVRYPNRYPSYLPPIKNKPYLAQVTVKNQIDLSRVAKLANISLAELHQLNPGYNRWSSAPNRPAKIILPVDKVDLFKENLAKSPTHARSHYKKYTVQSGETLSQIAKKYRLSASVLKKSNNLRHSQLRVGQKLLIPYRKSRQLSAYVKKATRRYLNRHHRLPGPRRIEHVVYRKHESLTHIARLYGVKPSQLRYWNNIPPSNILKRGDKILIWHPKGKVIYYRAQNGDSLWKIAKKYHVRITQLERWNHLSRNKPLRKHQQIVIYS